MFYVALVATHQFLDRLTPANGLPLATSRLSNTFERVRKSRMAT
jgi:hypothetical protein